MARRAWLAKTLAVLALAGPLAVAAAGTASADHRDRGWHGSGWHGGGYWRHGHNRHWRGHRHRHHGSGISGLFIFDLTPPPRRVYVAPPPVIVQPPPIVYRAPPQAYCREYTTNVLVNGQPVETYGTACLQPDGRWRIVSMN